MRCPNCDLINPENAVRCDCGYDFIAKEMKESYLTHSTLRLRKSKKILAIILSLLVMTLAVVLLNYFGELFTFGDSYFFACEIVFLTLPIAVWQLVFRLPLEKVWGGYRLVISLTFGNTVVFLLAVLLNPDLGYVLERLYSFLLLSFGFFFYGLFRILERHVQTMRRVIWIVFWLVIGANVFIGRPQFGVEAHAKTELESLPGKLSIGFGSMDHHWNYSVIKGKLKSMPNLRKAPEESMIGTAPLGGATGILPDEKDLYYNRPYLISPDNSLIVAGIDYKKQSTGCPTDFVLASVKDGRIVSKRGYENFRSIDGIAWSPDSKYFAIVQSTERPCFCILSILAYSLGHPARTGTYSLLIYDRYGDLYVQSKIVSGMGGSGGYLYSFIWE